jgi:hypothetical protein
MRLALLEKEQVAQENQNFEAALIESQSYISLPIAQRREQMRLSSIEAARLKFMTRVMNFLSGSMLIWEKSC